MSTFGASSTRSSMESRQCESRAAVSCATVRNVFRAAPHVTQVDEPCPVPTVCACACVCVYVCVCVCVTRHEHRWIRLALLWPPGHQGGRPGMISDVGSRGARGAGGICCVRNECSGCRETKPESGFSRKQWADRAHSRTCGSVRAWRGCGWS